MPQPLLVTLRALGLGDLLTAVPALRALRRRFPGHRHVLVTSADLAPIVRMGELADLHLALDGLRPLPQALCSADQAVNLHGSGPESHAILQALWPDHFTAFRHEDARPRPHWPSWDPDEHEVLRWCRLVEACGASADPTDLELHLGESDLAPEPDFDDVTLIHAGAKAPARRWPAPRWSLVARYEREAGRRVVLTGSRSEHDLVHTVAQDAGIPDRDLVVGAPLDRVARLVAAAARVVCGDTGIAHLATATGTPSVVLFGPTDPALWGPPPERSRHRVLWAGRRGDPLGSEPDPGLLEIGVPDVLCALAELDALQRSA